LGEWKSFSSFDLIQITLKTASLWAFRQNAFEFSILAGSRNVIDARLGVFAFRWCFFSGSTGRLAASGFTVAKTQCCKNATISVAISF